MKGDGGGTGANSDRKRWNVGGMRSRCAQRPVSRRINAHRIALSRHRSARCTCLHIALRGLSKYHKYQ